MKDKKFYEAQSVKLHAKLDTAKEAVVAVEAEIDENIRLLNAAPEKVEPAPEPLPAKAAAPPVVKK